MREAKNPESVIPSESRGTCFCLYAARTPTADPRRLETKRFIELESRKQSALRGRAQLLRPRFRALQRRIHRVDILHALGGQEILQRLQSLLRVDRHAVFPRRAAAQDARIIGARVRRHAETFNELRVAHARAQINKWFQSDV